MRFIEERFYNPNMITQEVKSMKRKKTNPRKGRSQEKGSNSELLSSVSLLTRNLSYPEYKEPTSKEIEALEKIIINGSEEEKEKARNDIFRGSLKYISKIAWSKVNKNPRLYEELFARAVLRVLEGLKDWDPREKPFSRYIKRMIDQEKENWDERSKKEKKHMLFNFDASGSMDQEYNENWQENKQLAISDANMVSEEEIASMMHGWLKKYFESIKELKLCSKGILSAHHQKFFSKALDHGLILQAIEAKLDPDLKALHGIKSLRVSVKKSTYAEHLDWFIPFLEKNSVRNG